MNEKVTLSRSEKILKACINGDETTYDPPQSRIEKLLLALKDKISEETVDLSNYYTKAETYSKNEVNTKLSTVYKVKGSSTIANLPTNPEVGDVYNITDSGTITGTEIEVSAGDNIVYTSDGWDKLAATVDLSGYATGKVTTIIVPTDGWTTSTDTNGVTYYTINITNSILTSTGYPIVDVVLSSDIAAARLQSEAYQNVNKITVNNGSVDLYCFDSLPTVSFQIRIQLSYI